jgi:hypothetical protein
MMLMGKYILQENIIKAFDLNEVHLQCKKNPLKMRKEKKPDLNTPTEGKDKAD